MNRNKLNKNNGITLIALVITIIVMLILVAVTINMAINGGLFEKAAKAVGETQNAINYEQQLANGKIQVDGKWYASIDDYFAGKIELPEGIKVGDYVNYTPDRGTYKVSDGTYGSGYTTDEGYQSFITEVDDEEAGTNALKWRILSINEETGEIELISATAGQILYLQKENGYNHGVDILNDLCETLYSKTIDGKKVATARSIAVEDINAKTTYDYTKYTNYGKVYKPSYKGYPKIYVAELGSTANGLNETAKLLNGSERVEKGTINESGVTEYKTYIGSSTASTLYATYTDYEYSPESYLKELGINTATKELLNVGTTYWVATRSISANSYYAFYRLRCVGADGKVTAKTMTESKLSTGLVGSGLSVRAVVSLGADINITKDNINSTETTTYWNIEF